MKRLQIILLFITVVNTLFLYSKIIIRPATLTDCDAIAALSSYEYHNTFKPMWLEKYAPTTHLEKSLDDFINEKITATNNANQEFIVRQENQEEYGLLVATIINENESEKLIGYCRFKKENAQAVYINFILFDENFRKQGIGKKLARGAMNTFTEVTQCNFRALIHNDVVNDLYKKQGCVVKGTIALEPNTGYVSTDPNAPATHFDYTFSMQKYSSQ